MVPGERLERGLERLAALQVEVVGRLVEHEQVRAGGDEQRERESTALAAGQHRDVPLVHLPPGEEEAAEQVLRLRPLEARRALGALEHRAARGQLLLVLREVRGHDAVPEPGPAARQLAPAQQRFDECRLPGAVRPDQPDVLPSLERELRAVQQLLVARRERRSSSASRTTRPERGGRRNSNPSVRRFFVSDWSSPAALARSLLRRPICVSFACACFAFVFL